MRNIAAAIELGTSKVICVIGRERSVGRFEVLGSGEAKYEGIKNGRWLKPSGVAPAAQKAIEIAEKMARKRVKEIYVSVPGTFCKVLCHKGAAKVEGVAITQQDVENLIDDAEGYFDDGKYTIVTSTPIYFMLDDDQLYIDVIGNKARQIRGMVSFVLATKNYIKNMRQVLKGLGIKVKAFIPEMLAESLFLVPQEERDSSAVLLNVGYYDTNVTVVYGDAIVYNKTIHAGGMHLANDLSIVMNMDVHLAEQIKKRYIFGLENTGTKLYDYAKHKSGSIERFNHVMVSEVIEARVEHLCQLIYRALQSSPLSVARRTRLFLSGGGMAMMKGVQETLQRQLKRQVRISGIEAPQLSTPNFYGALALLDYVFECDYYSEGYGGKSLFGRLSDKLYD